MHILLIFLVLFPFLAVAEDALVPPPSPFAIITTPYPLATLEHGQKIGALTFQDAVKLRSESYRFGGFSGLSILGNQLYAISDEGRLLRTTLNLNRNRIIGFTGGSLNQIWPEGEKSSKKMYDSEALVHLRGDRFLVGFEQHHRIAQYRFGKTIVLEKTFPAPPELEHITKENEGIEALVPLSHDTVFALTENARDANKNILGYIVNTKTKKWQTLALQPTENFSPTDIASLNKKYLILLERSYGLLDGMEARISLINRADIKPDALIKTTELAQLDSDSGIDNMEGISITQNRNGSADIFLISDDNFNPMQNTIVVWLTLSI